MTLLPLGWTKSAQLLLLQGLAILHSKTHEETQTSTNYPKHENGGNTKESGFKQLTREGDVTLLILKELNFLKESEIFDLKNLMKVKLYKDKYMSCVICHSLFNPKNMRKNARLCAAQSSESGKKALTVNNSWMFLTSFSAMDTKYKEFSANIIPCMFNGKTANLVEHNDLLMLYGYALHEMGGEEIFSKILNVSWLLMKFRKTNDISITIPS